MQDAISKLRGEEPALQAVAVISAFDVPKVRYDPVQKKWHADEEPRGQLATADAKHRVYLDRLQLVHQRMRRHRMFQQHSLVSAGPGRPPGAQLTDLQALKGVVGEPRIVMGCISQLEDGRHVLEDITASVPLDLSACQTTAGFFTENCIVIAEGELAHDGVLHVRALGFPPTEPREALALSGQRLNFFGGPALSPDEVSRTPQPSGLGRRCQIATLRHGRPLLSPHAALAAAAACTGACVSTVQCCRA